MTDEAEKRALEAAAAADMEKRNFNSGVRLEAACRAYARSLNNDGVWISREDAAFVSELAHKIMEAGDDRCDFRLMVLADQAHAVSARLRQQLGE